MSLYEKINEGDIEKAAEQAVRRWWAPFYTNRNRAEETYDLLIVALKKSDSLDELRCFYRRSKEGRPLFSKPARTDQVVKAVRKLLNGKVV